MLYKGKRVLFLKIILFLYRSVLFILIINNNILNYSKIVSIEK